MKTAFLISWRYQRTKQVNPLLSLISFFSTLGIALGVAVLILGLSTMNGFERELSHRILSVVPHAEILPSENKIESKRDLIQALEVNPQIKGISPFVTFTALIENGSKMKVVQIKGVEKVAQDRVSSLGNFVLDQAWQDFENRQGLILGYGIAKALDVKQGDWVTLLFSQNNEDDIAQSSRERIQIAGILRLDGQLDHSYALMPLALAQQYLAYDAQQISGVEIRVSDPFQVKNTDFSNLFDYPQSLNLHTWIAKFGYMYNDIQLVRTIMYIAMILVIGVACFNIVSTLVMAVKDKASDIAIMRTLGANNAFIKRIFICYGLLAGMKGCIIGIGLGIFLSLNLTALIQSFEKLIGHKLLSDGIYFVDFLPSELHWQDVLLVLVAALVLSLIASIYPAHRATKLEPAQVLSSY